MRTIGTGIAFLGRGPKSWTDNVPHLRRAVFCDPVGACCHYFLLHHQGSTWLLRCRASSSPSPLGGASKTSTHSPGCSGRKPGQAGRRARPACQTPSGSHCTASSSAASSWASLRSVAWVDDLAVPIVSTTPAKLAPLMIHSDRCHCPRCVHWTWHDAQSKFWQERSSSDVSWTWRKPWADSYFRQTVWASTGCPRPLIFCPSGSLLLTNILELVSPWMRTWTLRFNAALSEGAGAV